jgi:hypothetical protein
MEDEDVLAEAVLFKVNAEQCDLHVGDLIAPGTVIGDACMTGDALEAKHEGIVEAINSCNEDHALFVWLSPVRRE